MSNGSETNKTDGKSFTEYIQSCINDGWPYGDLVDSVIRVIEQDLEDPEATDFSDPTEPEMREIWRKLCSDIHMMVEHVQQDGG